MAEDDNAKADSDKVVPAKAPEVATPATEWTASDARGPLNAAGEPTEAQEVAPSHEHVAADPVTTVDQGSVSDEQPVAAGAPDPSLAATAARPPRRSLWPVAAGIVVGAIIGAGSAAAFYATRGGDSTQLSALAARVDAIQNRPDPQPEITTLKGSLADLGGKVVAVQKTVAAEAQSRQAAAQTPKKDDTISPAFDPGPLEQKIAALRSDLDALRSQGADVKAVDAKVAALVTTVAALKEVDGKVAALQSSVTGMQKQTSTAQASIDTLRSNQKALEGKVTSSPALAVVADSLVTQITRGDPYATQVEALASIGVDPGTLAVLKENADKGVPSAKSLAAKFGPLADPIIATEQHAAPNAGFLDRLKSGMFSMVSIRRADDTTGDTLASHVALLQADLAHDDVAGAYKVWSALPASAKAKSEAWGALAKTHAEAMQAARALQTQAIASLGAKKS